MGLYKAFGAEWGVCHRPTVMKGASQLLWIATESQAGPNTHSVWLMTWVKVQKV